MSSSFPNDACYGDGGKNGTCYTANECDARGGVTAGDCAGGYGVCCVREDGSNNDNGDDNLLVFRFQRRSAAGTRPARTGPTSTAAPPPPPAPAPPPSAGQATESARFGAGFWVLMEPSWSFSLLYILLKVELGT